MFRLYTDGKFNGWSSFPKTSSHYKEVMEKNVNNKTSFNDFPISIEKTLEESNTAFFGIKARVLSAEEYMCKVRLINNIGFFLE